MRYAMRVKLLYKGKALDQFLSAFPYTLSLSLSLLRIVQTICQVCISLKPLYFRALSTAGLITDEPVHGSLTVKFYGDNDTLVRYLGSDDFGLI